MNEKSLQINLSEIFASVYAKNAKGVYYVKVGIPSIGLYINSIRVSPSPKYPDKGLWVQMPAFAIYGKWIKPIEFTNNSQLKDYLEDEILRAVDLYQREENVVYELSEADLENGLDEAIKNLPP